MTNLITIADFAGIVPFSGNIGAHLVDPHVADAQLLDFLPRLPEALRTALAGPRPWGAALEMLWVDHLRRVLVLESARRMLLYHGIHITPSGLENTAQISVSDQQRTQLRADLQAKAAHFWPLALAAASLLYPPAPSTTCGPGRTRRPSSGGLRTAAL